MALVHEPLRSALVRRVTPWAAAQFLVNSGWKKVDQLGRKAAIYSKADHEQSVVMLPLDNSLHDYSIRMAELISSVSAVEKRRPKDLAQFLARPAADYFWTRIERSATADGSIPIIDGVRAFAATATLLQTAATVAADLSHTDAKKAAKEFLKSARMGQTKRGSYMISIYALTPEPSVNQMGLGLDVPPPFERIVFETLGQVLARAKDAAIEDTQEAFREAAFDGLTAQFCTAIGALGAGSDLRMLHFRFDWSWALPKPALVPDRFEIAPSYIPRIRAGAAHLRDTPPEKDFKAIGTVVRLYRGENSTTGQVTVQALVGKFSRPVHFSLHRDDYEKALAAHGEKALVAVTGVLTRVGRQLWLHGAKDFSVIGGN